MELQGIIEIYNFVGGGSSTPTTRRIAKPETTKKVLKEKVCTWGSTRRASIVVVADARKEMKPLYGMT